MGLDAKRLSTGLLPAYYPVWRMSFVGMAVKPEIMCHLGLERITSLSEIGSARGAYDVVLFLGEGARPSSRSLKIHFPSYIVLAGETAITVGDKGAKMVMPIPPVVAAAASAEVVFLLLPDDKVRVAVMTLGNELVAEIDAHRISPFVWFHGKVA